MKKIPTLFRRDEKSHIVVNEVTPGCEWVLRGEGAGTRKYDGTCCLVKDGKFYKRYEVQYKAGDNYWYSVKPIGYFEVDFDTNIGKGFGWVPVGEGPEDKWHREAWKHYLEVEKGLEKWGNRTYELCGPKVQGNPEGYPVHVLIPHPYEMYIADPLPRTFESIRDWLVSLNVEGVVYWKDTTNPDCDKVKIKLKDFGFKRKKV